MYDDLKANSSRRIVEIREIIDFIKPFIPKPPSAPPRHINSLKGMVYVQLYGLIEYTVLKIVEQTISYINQSNIKLNELKPILLSLALNSNLESLMNVNSKKWDKRQELFKALQLNPDVKIVETLLPTDGKNIHAPQLQSIWNVFCIDKPCFHDVRYSTSIKEIVGFRINIAHGNLSAAEVGSTISIEKLELRLNETSGFCTYIINVFEEYVNKEGFKNQTS